MADREWCLNLNELPFTKPNTPKLHFYHPPMSTMKRPARGKLGFCANLPILGLEDGASSQSKNIIAELRSVHDLARVDRFVLKNILTFLHLRWFPS